ncbi:MAG: hypothetical protein CMP24_02305 [Rickettsiales bacterium]|nr:hypothetical protein [Rickettsiales bacterium]
MYDLKYISHKNSRINKLLKALAQLHPKDIDLSLGRIKKLLEKLDNPHLKLSNVIHIAGTNGKGSTATIIFQLLANIGKKVNVYRSPHILSFNERIFLNNKKISDKYLIEVLEKVYDSNDKNPITFFEIFTAGAFLAFSENPSDVNIIEVGLGGKLDATNVIKNNKISIITPIGLDHKNFLGEKITEIAAEKAGIIESNGITICSKQEKKVYPVLAKKIIQKKNISFIYGKDWIIKNKIMSYKNINIDLSNLSLLGDHQYLNAGCAILACENMYNLEIKPKKIITGLSQISWPGRLQKIEGRLHNKYKDINIWIDAAHNGLGFKVLEDWIKKNKLNRLAMILGLGTNKDINDIIPYIVKINPSILCLVKNFKISNINPYKIKKVSDALKVNTIVSENISSSIEMCSSFLKNRCNKNLLVTGSISLISEVLELD